MKNSLKKAYLLIPFKKKIFSLLKIVYKPSQKVYKHLHFNDQITVAISKSEKFRMMHFGYQIENEIFWNGLFNGWEKHSLQVWTELSRNSDVIFDIGANTGIYSMISKAVNSNAEIYAFEPVKRVMDKLKINNDLNSFDCKLYEKAISNFTGTATIFDKNTEHTYSVTVNKDISPDKSDSIEVEIETIRLDDFIRENHIERINLMKIDVETHEVEALEGMGDFIKKFTPTMLIEVLNDHVANGIEKLLDGIDYNFYNIHEKNGLKKVDHLKKCEYRNFLICTKSVAKSINLEE